MTCHCPHTHTVLDVTWFSFFCPTFFPESGSGGSCFSTHKELLNTAGIKPAEPGTRPYRFNRGLGKPWKNDGLFEDTWVG